MPEKDKSRVLVVDDEADFAFFVQAVLQDNGCEARVAKDAEEASRIMEDYKPDLITLDLMMPDKSGIKFYRELRTGPWKDTPVIIVTGVDHDSEGVVSFRNFLKGKNVEPPDAYLDKPLDGGKLIKAVREALSK